jgi:hypothetical protein
MRQGIAEERSQKEMGSKQTRPFGETDNGQDINEYLEKKPEVSDASR